MYGIYANIWGILMVNVTIYIAYMDPMGKWSLVIQYVCRVFISQWIGLMENLQENPRFKWENLWIPVRRSSQQNRSIEYQSIYLAVN